MQLRYFQVTNLVIFGIQLKHDEQSNLRKISIKLNHLVKLSCLCALCNTTKQKCIPQMPILRNKREVVLIYMKHFLLPELLKFIHVNPSLHHCRLKIFIREEMQACTMKRDRAYLNFAQCGLHKFRKHKILATSTFLKVKPLNFVQEPQEKPNARIIQMSAYQQSMSREHTELRVALPWNQDSPTYWVRYDHYFVKNKLSTLIQIQQSRVQSCSTRLYVIQI